MEADGRVRPEDHFFNALICSAISFDNGTKLFIEAATSISVGSLLRSNAANIASRNTASISALLRPSSTFSELKSWPYEFSQPSTPAYPDYDVRTG